MCVGNIVSVDALRDGSLCLLRKGVECCDPARGGPRRPPIGTTVAHWRVHGGTSQAPTADRAGGNALRKAIRENSVDSGGGLTNNYLCWCCWCCSWRLGDGGRAPPRVQESLQKPFRELVGFMVFDLALKGA